MIPQLKNKFGVAVVALAFAVTPTIMGATTVESVIGDTCLVPVIHTNFAFPPEGGKIVKIGNQMYFVQDYRTECASAGANGQLIKGSGTVAGTTSPPPSTPTNPDNSNCLTRVN